MSLEQRKAECDSQMMRRALALARRGEGRVEPNPMVGCVIARHGRILAEGYHRRFGGPHAEMVALRNCGDRTDGATVYVTLEPCCTHGKTPPCTDALKAARVSRIVVAARDPNPGVNGRGLRRLRAAGMAVERGLLADEACDLLAPFATWVRLGRSYVIAKWAQSLDGKLATPAGHSKWISCETSRRKVHRLRARVDAIIVGSGTVLADDPMLTARDVPIRRTATRIVLDGRLRIGLRSALAQSAHAAPTMAITTPANARSTKARRLARLGVEVIGCRPVRGRCAPAECLEICARRGFTNVLLEGGPTLLTSFFSAGLIDEAWVFTAPRLIGGHDAPSVISHSRVRRADEALEPLTIRTQSSGCDTLHRLRFTSPPLRA